MYKKPFTPYGLTLLVLELVDRLGEEATATGIATALWDRRRSCCRHKVHHILQRLYWNSMIQIVGTSTSSRQGARAKVYGITRMGRDALEMHNQLFDGFTRKTDMWAK